MSASAKSISQTMNTVYDLKQNISFHSIEWMLQVVSPWDGQNTIGEAKMGNN